MAGVLYRCKWAEGGLSEGNNGRYVVFINYPGKDYIILLCLLSEILWYRKRNQ